jgi:TatD DNase family protein
MIKEISAEEAVKNAVGVGVDKIIEAATEPDDFPAVIKLVNTYEEVYGLLGVHPTEAKNWHDGLIKEITALAQNPKIVGIGEIGLDYYHDRNFIDLQKKVFIEQIRLANSLELPINVHDRDAHEDCFEILQRHNDGSKVVMHCFSGDLEFARKCVDAGYYLGIGGVVTFKNAKALKEVAAQIPLEYIVLETDTPFLAPTPHRGEENQPAYVRLIAEEIAVLRGISVEETARVTTSSAGDIFGI